MTRLWNDPADFADEMIAGFVAANPRHVRRVPGGVVRRQDTPEGQVAVVIGGGSGHYPAFGGLVGYGLAHGAAMGNLFASPSTQQILSVAREAERGGGVILSYGNYVGDVLNFDAAQQRLRADGVPCETVLVTDDIYSAGPEERERRRGIAGDLAVFRIAASAAESGYDLAAAAGVARRANERTRSVGVAFSGCTLPGAERPLFEVPEGRMALGLGIHGEPGIEETGMPSADGLAELLVSRLLAEVPAGAQSRVVPILNGLGSLKYEELFVVYRRIAEELARAGLSVVDPHVGEFCTSFDMAGCSLTLLWLDDELDGLWERAVDTPAYRRSTVVRDVASSAAQRDVAPEAAAREAVRDVPGETVAQEAAAREAVRDVPGETVTQEAAARKAVRDVPGETVTREAAARAAVQERVAEPDERSKRAAQFVVAALRCAAGTIDAHVEELGRLDAIAGDGDHGIGMQRGVTAALAAAEAAVAAGAGSGSSLAAAGDAWADRSGGTSGALWGIILRSLAGELDDRRAPEATDLARGWSAAADAVMTTGKASPGDKTLVDALVPFARTFAALADDGATLAVSWRAAADEAQSAAAATADLLPRIGRARPHAQKSLGIPDPGAFSLALILQSVARTLEPSHPEHEERSERREREDQADRSSHPSHLDRSAHPEHPEHPEQSYTGETESP